MKMIKTILKMILRKKMDKALDQLVKEGKVYFNA